MRSLDVPVRLLGDQGQIDGVGEAGIEKIDTLFLGIGLQVVAGGDGIHDRLLWRLRPLGLKRAKFVEGQSNMRADALIAARHSMPKRRSPTFVPLVVYAGLFKPRWSRSVLPS